jgi:hypothetical protein
MNKLFGIGLQKTGTNSLTVALNLLGVNTIHYPHDNQTYDELKRAHYNLSIMQKYQGATDLPIALYYPHLDKQFPNSKFILTVRDLDSWLTSTENHWRVNQSLYNENQTSPRPEYKKMALFLATSLLGCHFFERQRFSYCYQKHNQDVENYFVNRREDFLILDVSKSNAWELLANFLNKPVPNIDFPHENKGTYPKSFLKVYQ